MTWLRRLSVKSRVTLSATLLLSCALLAAAFTLTALEKRSLIHEIDTELSDRIDGLLGNASNGETVDVPLTGRETGVVQIIDARGSVVAATPSLHGAAVLNAFAPSTRRTAHRTVRRAVGTIEDETWRIAGRRATTARGTYDFFTGTSLETVDHTISRLRITLLAGVPLLLAIFAGISWLTTRWSLAPVEQLTNAVDAMSPTDLRHELPEPAANDELAHLVRTMNLLLGRVDDARRRERRFAADASHELRTPITTARLNLEIAKANPTPERLADAVDETLHEVDRLEELARDLLELTRLDTRKVRAHAVEVDLGAMVSGEVEGRRRRVPDIDYRCVVAEPTTAPGVHGLLLRVVRNLLNNAERHAETAIAVEVRSECSTESVTGGRADRAVIEVHNDGAGIAPADRLRIFEPFTRLDEARTRDDGGTGLGLAIAADVVDAHGGTIAVVDDGRKGVTFQVVLPRTPLRPVRSPDDYDGVNA